MCWIDKLDKTLECQDVACGMSGVVAVHFAGLSLSATHLCSYSFAGSFCLCKVRCGPACIR
jgi:hypothetical protein